MRTGEDEDGRKRRGIGVRIQLFVYEQKPKKSVTIIKPSSSKFASAATLI